MRKSEYPLKNHYQNQKKKLLGQGHKHHNSITNYFGNKKNKESDISNIESYIKNEKMESKKEDRNDNMEIEMRSDNEESSKNKKRDESMNISKEEEFLNVKNQISLYNNTDNSYGDNYSTANSIKENEKNKNKNKIKKDIIKEEKNENPCSNQNENKTKDDKDMDIIMNKINEEDKKFDIKYNIENIQNVNEYMDEILENLLIEEKNMKYEINPNYFEYQKEINRKMRSILIDWLIDVHNKFNYKEETLYIAIYLMDSYLSKKYLRRNRFQLLGITSLLIASKFNEIYFRRVEDCAFITDNAYSVDDIKNMEEDISETLHFNFLVPSCLSFFEIICKKVGLSEDKDKFKFGEFLIQTFLMDFHSLNYSYSSIACTCCYIVMKFYKMSNYQDCYNSKFYNIKNEIMNDNNEDYIIKECAKNVCGVINETLNSNLQSSINKYNDCKFLDDIKKILRE